MTPSRQNRRTGLTTLMAVLTFTILFIAAVFSYSVFSTSDSYKQLRNISQAASLAGAGSLAHDDMLTNNSAKVLARINAARLTATQVAEVNQIKGLFLSMDPQNPTNDPTGNMVFGTLDKQLGGTFTPLNLTALPADTARINAVRLEVTHPKRTGLKVKMYAHIDHNIIGFKPTNNVNAPVVPVAMFSDTSGGLADHSYERASVAPTDTAQYDNTTKLFIQPGTDGIPEVKFEYIVGGGPANANPTVISVRNLNIGATVWADAQLQVLSGITLANVAGAPFNGSFALADPGPVLAVPEFTPAPAPSLAEFAAAFTPFTVTTPLIGAIPRVFPLYSGTDLLGNVNVTGFVAARVVSVDTTVDRVTVTIQPTLISSPLAVTGDTCPVTPGAPFFNRTIGKLRLAATVTEAP